ncbi:MAG: Spy/CpxP family protein refolding chaperone [Acidobacteriota bacterium]
MNPRNRRIAAVAALGVALAATAAWGAHAAIARRPLAGGGFLFQRIAARLQLTPDQVQQVKQIVRSHQAELDAEITAVAVARRGLFDAIHAESFSEPAIRAAAGAAGRAESDLAVTRGAIVQELRAVLTPEQQSTATQMLQDLEARVLDRVEMFRSRLQTFLD